MNITRSNFLLLLYTLFSLTFFCACRSNSQITSDVKNPSDHFVKISGEMRNVMWKGELYGTVDIDTIAEKEHLYGLGPVEYLRGEITVIDGKGYRSRVINDTAMEVTQTLKLKAPFFAYADISNWYEKILPDSVLTLEELENFLDLNTDNISKPFIFKLTGIADSAVIHVVNLPEGTKVSSPEEAHQGQKNYRINDRKVELIGFYSTGHKGIFTHHDTNVHIHLITEEKDMMGHLEKIGLRRGTVKLYLPEQ